MKKEMKESIIAVLILIGVFALGYEMGYEMGEDDGFDKGVEVNHGDRWDCAYSYATGFLMCDRTPKYKD